MPSLRFVFQKIYEWRSLGSLSPYIFTLDTTRCGPVLKVSGFSINKMEDAKVDMMNSFAKNKNQDASKEKFIFRKYELGETLTGLSKSCCLKCESFVSVWRGGSWVVFGKIVFGKVIGNTFYVVYFANPFL